MSDWEAREGEHGATSADRDTRMLAGFVDVVPTAPTPIHTSRKQRWPER